MVENEDVKTPPDFRPQGIRFDKTVTMGNLLTLIGGIIAMGAAYVDYRVTMDRLEVRATNTEARVLELSARMTEESQARASMTHAIDRLTTIIEMQNQQHKP